MENVGKLTQVEGIIGVDNKRKMEGIYINTVNKIYGTLPDNNFALLLLKPFSHTHIYCLLPLSSIFTLFLSLHTTMAVNSAGKAVFPGLLLPSAPFVLFCFVSFRFTFFFFLILKGII